MDQGEEDVGVKKYSLVRRILMSFGWPEPIEIKPVGSYVIGSEEYYDRIASNFSKIIYPVLITMVATLYLVSTYTLQNPKLPHAFPALTKKRGSAVEKSKKMRDREASLVMEREKEQPSMEPATNTLINSSSNFYPSIPPDAAPPFRHPSGDFLSLC